MKRWTLAPLAIGLLLAARPVTADEVDDELKADPAESYAAALKEAALFRQNVAIMFVGPKSTTWRDLEAFSETNELPSDGGDKGKASDSPVDVDKTLNNYRLLSVDAKLAAAQKLAKSLGVTLATGKALPQIVLRDAAGKPLAEATADKLSVGGKFDQSQLAKFLQAHTPKPLDAKKLLDDALAEAGRTGRRVMVQRTAIWCHPCHMLTLYFDQQRSILDKGFIWVRMDERWTGCDDIADRIDFRQDDGIPFTVILDADGKILANTRGKDGENYGFPHKPEFVEHFLTMLGKNAKQLTAEDLVKLRAAIKWED